MTNQNKPKITIILQKNGKKVFLYPSYRKTQFFIRNKADSYFKKGFLITIRVNYGYGINAKGESTLFRNEGTYQTLDDLKWAFGAFVREYSEDYEKTKRI